MPVILIESLPKLKHALSIKKFRQSSDKPHDKLIYYVSNDVRLYKKIDCTFCAGTRELYPYALCPYCDKTGTTYVEASIKSIAEYCNTCLTSEELNKMIDLLDS